ncbi:glycosyltransferase [Sphingomonas arenae]|uniref:glycosyltransferase n=1 Tax=Sphingomonas arenae TaxID=2812555 RepID=UPI001966D44A|nr:glycosyltransferase [Sphingomonas arenae]
MANGSRVLYLSYDGMTDPLGRSQVLPYLVELSAMGHDITVVSFEKPHRRSAMDHVRAICAEAGLHWNPQTYTKHPPILSTWLDIARMNAVAEHLHAERPFDLVHCRSDLPALAGLRLKRRHGLPFLFDMRGFWADERVDGGLWNLRNPLYRAVHAYFKRQERAFMRDADAVVSLTHAAEAPIASEAPGIAVDVIPCCADLALFTPPTAQERSAARASLGIPQEVRVPVYLGSMGTWYMLGEMLDAFAVQRARSPGATMLWVTPDSPDLIHAEASRRGLQPGSLVIRSATRNEVRGLLAAADYGLFFIKPAPSKVASSPVKLGELLAMDLPVLTNGGIGDVEAILRESGAGVTIDRFDPATYANALERLEGLRPDPVQAADTTRRWFDLDEGVRRYDAIYRRVSLGNRRIAPLDIR